MKDKVIHNSESTVELPPIDYVFEYNILMRAKDVANQISKNNNELGLDAYVKVIINYKRDWYWYRVLP